MAIEIIELTILDYNGAILKRENIEGYLDRNQGLSFKWKMVVAINLDGSYLDNSMGHCAIALKELVESW